jgi:hypothetical protein
MLEFYGNQRNAYSDGLTGQEVTYEEIIDILAHRHDISLVGDNDTF